MRVRKERIRGKKYSPAERQLALRVYFETRSGAETVRRTGIPEGTLFGWLSEPAFAQDVEEARGFIARATAADDDRACREAAAGIVEGVARCREKLRTAKRAREVAQLQRALVETRVRIHALTRTEAGKPSSYLGLVSEEADALDVELRELLRDRNVVARLKTLLQ